MKICTFCFNPAHITKFILEPWRDVWLRRKTTHLKRLRQEIDKVDELVTSEVGELERMAVVLSVGGG